jgi:hypothetical protein
MPSPLRDLIDNVTAGFIKGTWADRLARLARVFGTLPVELSNLAPKLQTLQTKRNRIAHEFGNEGKGRIAPWDAFNVIAVGPKDIDTAIKSVSESIRLLDAKVWGSTIGGHEVLHQFHLWKLKEPHFNRYTVEGSLSSEFRSFVGKRFSRPLGSSYVNQMIQYYNNL